MKPSDFLKKKINESVKKTFKENVNEGVGDVRSSSELGNYFSTVQKEAEWKMRDLSGHILRMVGDAKLRYENAYNKFIDTFGDHITGEISCEVEYGEIHMLFSTDVPNSNEAWDDINSLTSRFGGEIEKFCDYQKKYHADLAYESKDTLIVSLYIDIIPTGGLTRTYVDILNDIDPSLCDRFDPDDYED